MHCVEFKNRLSLLGEEERKYVYTLTLVEAVEYLKKLVIVGDVYA